MSPRGTRNPPPALMSWVTIDSGRSAGMRNDFIVSVISYALYPSPDGNYQLTMMLPAPKGRRYPVLRFQSPGKARDEAERLFRIWITAMGLDVGPQTVPRVPTARSE